MLRDTIRKIEERLERLEAVPPEKREELLTLLGALRDEVNELAKSDAEHAESIKGFVDITAHEATREEKNPRLLQHAVDGLASTVQDLELSRPRLVENVNAICSWLASVGI